MKETDKENIIHCLLLRIPILFEECEKQGEHKIHIWWYKSVYWNTNAKIMNYYWEERKWMKREWETS